MEKILEIKVLGLVKCYKLFNGRVGTRVCNFWFFVKYKEYGDVVLGL